MGLKILFILFILFMPSVLATEYYYTDINMNQHNIGNASNITGNFYGTWNESGDYATNERLESEYYNKSQYYTNATSTFEPILIKGLVSATTPISVTGSRYVIGGTMSITHSSSAGYKHIPTGGLVGQLPANSASGTLDWSNIIVTSGGLKNVSFLNVSGSVNASAFTIGTNSLTDLGNLKAIEELPPLSGGFLKKLGDDSWTITTDFGNMSADEITANNITTNYLKVNNPPVNCTEGYYMIGTNLESAWCTYNEWLTDKPNYPLTSSVNAWIGSNYTSLHNEIVNVNDTALKNNENINMSNYTASFSNLNAKGNLTINSSDNLHQLKIYWDGSLWVID